MRVALVHDWLTSMRGGERVLAELIRLLPDAELFTLVHVPGSVTPEIERLHINSSWLNGLPGIRHWYRQALPLFPHAIERFDLRGFDLVISSSHCAAKGVRVPAGVSHVCYCHTPMRYLYDQGEAYARRSNLVQRAGLALTRTWLQRWDIGTASRVTRFIANSRHVHERITHIYGRQAGMVHPPVDVERFQPAQERDDYYLSVAALVPYKRVDLVVRAFNQLGRRLIVVGSGPERTHLERIARSNIEFTGWITDASLAALLAGARGLVFAGVEDFGIALVEAQAAGTPVIAYAAGGALETVVAGETGVLFREQTADSVQDAVRFAEQLEFAPGALYHNALRFRPERFRDAMRVELDNVLARSTLVDALNPAIVQ
jgi:glycosyltransferase involved in cell wall biosynthesis